MNYVFFGTPEFSAVILERLIDAGMSPSLVITNPDRPIGRKQIMTSSPVKLCIENQVESIKSSIKILQPEKVEDILNTLYSLPDTDRPSFAVLASYGKIIPKGVIELFPKGIIVVHPSLLPKYRGATPIQAAILNGDEETGTTLILMDEKVDHGAIVASRKYQVESRETYSTLHDKLAKLSADLLIETIPRFLSGEIEPTAQDESKATYTKKFTSEDAFVSESDLEEAQKGGGDVAVAIDRKIRGLNPEPGTWSIIGGKRTKLLESEIIGGKLKLKEIQVEGKNPQTIN